MNATDAQSQREPARERRETAFSHVEELTDCRGRRAFVRMDPEALDFGGGSHASEDAPSESAPETQAEPGSEIRAEPGSETRAEPGSETRAEGDAPPPPSASAPEATLRQLLELGAKITVATSLSEGLSPDARRARVEALGLQLSERLEVDVVMPDDCAGESARLVQSELREGQLCLLPDLSEHPGEARLDEAFSRQLASSLEVYVSEAFGALSLDHASVTRVPRLARSRVVGHGCRRQLEQVSHFVRPNAPRFALVVGGPFSENVELIRALLPRAARLFAAGGVASTLAVAAGRGKPDALTEPQFAAQARSLSRLLRDHDVEVFLPSDVRVASGGDGPTRVLSAQQLDERQLPIDLGPESCAQLLEALDPELEVVWVGALGNVQKALTRNEEPGLQSSQRLLRHLTGRKPKALVVSHDLARLARQLELPRDDRAPWTCPWEQSARALLTGRHLAGLEVLRRLG